MYYLRLELLEGYFDRQILKYFTWTLDILSSFFPTPIKDKVQMVKLVFKT